MLLVTYCTSTPVAPTAVVVSWLIVVYCLFGFLLGIGCQCDFGLQHCCVFLTAVLQGENQKKQWTYEWMDDLFFPEHVQYVWACNVNFPFDTLFFHGRIIKNNQSTCALTVTILFSVAMCPGTCICYQDVSMCPGMITGDATVATRQCSSSNMAGQQTQLGSATEATGQCHSVKTCGSQVSIGSLTKTGGMEKTK